MGRRSIRTIQTLVGLILTIQVAGCESVERYFRDRGRDLTDIVDTKKGRGGGFVVKVEATLFAGAGLGAGDFTASESWGREIHEVYADTVQFGLAGLEETGHMQAELNLLGLNLPSYSRPEGLRHILRFGGEGLVFGRVRGAYFNVGELLEFCFGIFGLDLAEDDETSQPPEPFSDELIPVFLPPVDAGGVFFVIDHSGSAVSKGTLQYVRRMVPRMLEDLSSEDRFGVIYFGQRIIAFRRGYPVPAYEATKRAATEFVDAVGQGSGSCVEEGLHAALDLVDASDVEENAIVYVGDGGGTCRDQNEDAHLGRALESVTSRNAGRARIYTVLVGKAGGLQKSFLEELARENGGTYHQVFPPELPLRR